MTDYGKKLLRHAGLVLTAVVILGRSPLVHAETPTDRLTAPAKVEQPLPGRYQFEIAMSRDEKLCVHFANAFNNDLRRYGYERFGDHEEFNRVRWTEIDISVDTATGAEKSKAKAAMLDIDNNGVDDFVVNWAQSLSGVIRDHLYILAADTKARAETLTSKKLFQTSRRLSIDWGYRLQPPFEAQELEFTVLQPFIFGGKAFLYMRPIFEVIASLPSRFAVIAEYSGGSLENASNTEVLREVCYLERIRATNKRP